MVDSPIFIVGLPRSGTTLMRSLVTAHPRIAIAPETHFLRKFGTSSPSRSSFEVLWTAYSTTPRFKDLGLDAEDIKQRVVESGDFSARNVFRTVLVEFARGQRKARWGEKTPSHYVYVRELLEWFSDARIIWVIRDPRAICNSLRSVYWRQWEQRGLRAVEGTRSTRLRRMYFDSRVWQRHVRLLQTASLDDDRVKFVLYEDLVCDPVKVLVEVGEFLNEDFGEDMVTARSWSDLSTIPRELLSDRRGLWLREHFEQVVRPITQDSVDKWRTNLTRLEIQIIEAACHEGMELLGYPRIEHGGANSSVGKLKIAVAQSWGFVFWAVYGAWQRSRAAVTGADPGPNAESQGPG